METPSLQSSAASELWQTDTTYSFNNTTSSGTNDPNNGKIYLSANGETGWDNTNVATTNSLANVKDIIVAQGSYEQVLTTGSITITVVMNDGTTSTGTATFTGTQNSSGLKKYTFLRFTSTYGVFLLGPREAGSTANLTASNYDQTFPTTIYCFLTDVQIETPSGAKFVQDLRVGDEIITVENNQKYVQKITSIVSKNVIVMNKDQSPIRILKSAITDNVPYKDLLITPEHCLFIEGQFIPARMLVNGRSIIQDTSYTTYDYYHIETEEHSVVIADGMLTESYLDTGSRINNHLSVTGKKTWENDAAAPLNTSQNFVETIYKQIENRANLQNFPDNSVKNKLTYDRDLYLTTPEGHILSAIYTKGNYIAFRLPPNVDHVTLHSRTSRPSDVVGPFIDDRRSLGVLINNITLSDNDQTFTIDTYLNIKNLSGWSIQEPTKCRWTLGKAELPLTKRTKDTIGILRISVISGGPYIVEEEQTETIQKAI